MVVPTIREDCAARWLREWVPELPGARIILTEDNPEPTFTLPGAEHYSWRDFGELGDDAWIIPRRTSACRSFGFLKALQGGCDVIWTTDDDCYPEEGRRGTYLKQWEAFCSAPPAPDDTWWNTIGGTGLYPRGYPYRIRDASRPVVLHHGLWSNVPDLDGETQLAHPDFRLPPSAAREAIPSGRLFPLCIMNVAFRAEMTPLMYMLLMGQDQDGNPWGFDRFDDIWAGLFMKRAADHLGWAVTSGAPSVRHSRASDPHRNVALEAAGRRAHEDFWPYIAEAGVTGHTPAECYLSLANEVEIYRGDAPREGYWETLADAMRTWARLCGEAALKGLCE